MTPLTTPASTPARRRALITGIASTALLTVAFVVPAQAVRSPAVPEVGLRVAEVVPAGPDVATITLTVSPDTFAQRLGVEIPDVTRRAAATPRLASDAHPDHLYSWPNWYPLRDEGAKSSCVKTNCPGKSPGEDHYHGKWAIDWNVPKVDENGNTLDVPVFAAGHGIAHIGGRAIACDAESTLSTKGRGNWAWIDHGGGLVTLYYHFDSFAPGLDGAAVTPRTRIGYAGSTGNPCRNAKYLHFEIKTGGIRGESIDMGQLRACLLPGDTMIELPDHLDHESWDDLPYQPNPLMPHTSKNCVPTSAPTTLPAPAAPAVGQTGTVTTVSWPTPPTSNRETMVGLEQWSATLGDFRPMEYHPASSTATSRSFGDLVLGGRYRFSIAHRNTTGWSNWSSTTEVSPALAPSPPAQVVATSGINWIRLDWARPANNGTPVTGYTVERAVQLPDGDWAPVRSFTTTASDMRWNDLTNQTYRLRVRALSAAGPSPWSRTLTISTVAPDPPAVPANVVTMTGRNWIRLDWARPANNGTPVTGYVVARSTLRNNGTWTAWTSVRTKESDMRWNDLRGRQTFRLKVRATSAAGPSRWSAVRTVSNPW
jgi:hypothetical protein